MLAIRLQRVGRKKLAHYRVIVQDSHRSPTAGKIVTNLGSYNPHTKEVYIDKDKAQKFLDNGAQPSNRVAMLLKTNGVKLPDWVKLEQKTKRATKNPDKLRKNQSVEEVPAADPKAPSEDPVSEESTQEEVAKAETTTKPQEADTAKEAAEVKEEPKAESEAEVKAEDKPESTETEGSAVEEKASADTESN